MAKKILVADDSLTIQKVIRLALSGDGYEIQTVSDGKEALEQASLFRPDICIIDVSLPQFDAYQVREQLLTKPDLKNIPVILMSSAFEKVDESRAQSLGFAGHLIKPFDPSHLRSTLLSVANHAPQNDPVSATINEPYHEEPTIRLEPATNSVMRDFPPISEEVSAMDDIQQLAKNTFEMSGLDQHDWGMIEPGRVSEPMYESPVELQQPQYPHPAGADDPREVSSLDLNDIPHASGYSGGQHQISVTAHELEAMVKTEVAKLLDQMHTQIQERLEVDIRNLAQRQVPDLAERILKEEIHKLLSDPPN